MREVPLYGFELGVPGCMAHGIKMCSCFEAGSYVRLIDFCDLIMKLTTRCSSILLVKTMLYNKLHCEQVYRLNVVSYQTRSRARGALRDSVRGATRVRPPRTLQ